MRALGPITHLQIQRSSLKVGLLGERCYSPVPLQPVAELRVTPEGVALLDGEARTVLDVHNRNHPESKQARSGVNAVSVGFSAHYAAMRERFGDHLADGMAGENILIDADGRISEDDLGRGLLIVTADGQELRLCNLQKAEPCLEFTRFALQYPPTGRADDRVSDGLNFLRGGMRGFYATYDGPPVTVRLGDSVFLPPD